MEEIVKIDLNGYEKNPDGSWTAVKNSDIVTKSGSFIRIAPGMSFRKGVRIWGLDVVEVLDKMSAN
ncbi:hypothetical protein [Desulfatiglans anilini]|uniref:hypothetical protein n=1 Tax=Desulfatiglans anilini TaxID=90728 RepID=UPI00041341AF|nr:hypothetical protein [Desulfatiglans anilini]